MYYTTVSTAADLPFTDALVYVYNLVLIKEHCRRLQPGLQTHSHIALTLLTTDIVTKELIRNPDVDLDP